MDFLRFFVGLGLGAAAIASLSAAPVSAQEVFQLEDGRTLILLPADQSLPDLQLPELQINSSELKPGWCGRISMSFRNALTAPVPPEGLSNVVLASSITPDGRVGFTGAFCNENLYMIDVGVDAWFPRGTPDNISFRLTTRNRS